MINRKSLKRYFRQIIAIVEKNIFLEFHIKANLISRFLNPIIELIISIFIFGIIFNVNKGYKIGYWNGENYVLFLLIAFSVQFSKSIINKYYLLFIEEKYWKTLSAIMTAPVNRFTLLISILISELVMNSFPLCILIISAYVLFPISLFFVFCVMLIYFSIFIIFASIGLILGAFNISNEEFFPYISLILRIIFLFSCINYPKEIFPDFIQTLIVINPLYQLFDLLRLVWFLGINYEEAIKLISIYQIIIVIVLTISFPLISLFIFEYVYKKYGITGY